MQTFFAWPYSILCYVLSHSTKLDIFCGTEEKGGNKAGQCTGKQGNYQQKRKITQDHGAAQSEDGHGHLADIVGGGAADADAVQRQPGQTFQEDHHQQRKKPSHQRKKQRIQITGKKAAQKAPGNKNGQCRKCPQFIESKHRDDIGQSQFDTGQRDQQIDGNQIFQSR